MNEVRTYNGHGEVSGGLPVRVESGSDFLTSLQNAVRENPVSAALIGMGVFWMFMGGSGVSLFGGGGRKSMFGTTVQGAGQFAGAARNFGMSIGDNVNQARQATMQPAWQAGSAAAGAMGDAASGTAARATDAAVSGYQAGAEMASRTAAAMTNATAAAGSALQETAAKWSTGVQGTLSNVFERQPLLLGAVGLAIGAVIAASLPTSEAEKQMMGEASDRLRDKVSEKTSEIAGQMKQMADAALDEAKAQGITPEKVGETLQALGNKVTGDGQGKERTGASGGPPSAGKSGSSSLKS
jgi:hypothetical protein